MDLVKETWEDEDCMCQLVQTVTFNVLQCTMDVVDEFLLITPKEKNNG